MFFRRAQAGSILVQILVVAGVVALSLFAMTTLVQNMGKSGDRERRKQSFTRFVSNLRVKLEDPHLCYQMLQGQSIIPETGKVEKKNFQIRSLSAFSDSKSPLDPLIKEGWVSPQGDFAIDRIEVLTIKPIEFVEIATATNKVKCKNKPITDNRCIRDREIFFDRPLGIDNPLVKYLIEITLIPKGIEWAEHWGLRVGNVVSDVDPSLKIKLVAKVNPLTNIIYACQGPLSVAEACEQAGGSYDATLFSQLKPKRAPMPLYRCQPNGQRCYTEKATTHKVDGKHVNLDGMRRTPASRPPRPPNCCNPDASSVYGIADWIGRISCNQWKVPDVDKYDPEYPHHPAPFYPGCIDTGYSQRCQLHEAKAKHCAEHPTWDLWVCIWCNENFVEDPEKRKKVNCDSMSTVSPDQKTEMTEKTD